MDSRTNSFHAEVTSQVGQNYSRAGSTGLAELVGPLIRTISGTAGGAVEDEKPVKPPCSDSVAFFKPLKVRKREATKSNKRSPNSQIQSVSHVNEISQLRLCVEAVPSSRADRGRKMARIKPQALLQQSKKKKQPSRISATPILFGGLIVLIALFFLYSTYTHRSIRSSIQNSNANSGFEDGSMMSDLKKSDVPGYVIFTTSKGPVTVELYKDSSPEIVDKFIDLCQKGHFKGMQFVRVIKHYVIQAGSTDNLGNTEDWTVKGKHHGQLHSSMKHEAFMVGTSNGKHDDKGFDLFITTAPIPDLSEKLVVFGRVVKGEDVIQEIEEVDTDERYRPKSQIGIIGVTLKQKA